MTTPPSLPDLPPHDDGLQDLLSSPTRDVTALQHDMGLAIAVARADVVPTLAGWFTPQPGRGIYGWVHDVERTGPVGRASVCVTWSFGGAYQTERRRSDGDVVDVARGENTSFNGLQALGQQIAVHGVTFLELTLPHDATTPELQPLDLVIRRYVDWAGVYTQLGLTLGWRLAHEAATRHTR